MSSVTTMRKADNWLIIQESTYSKISEKFSKLSSELSKLISNPDLFKNAIEQMDKLIAATQKKVDGIYNRMTKDPEVVEFFGREPFDDLLDQFESLESEMNDTLELFEDRADALKKKTASL